MRIHKEGHRKIIRNIIFYVVLSTAAYIFLPLWASIPVIIIFTAYLGLIIRFFRVPTNRVAHAEDSSLILSPADGTIVAIEEVFEDEYFHEKRIQVSVFMSIWNIHINWFPVSGTLEYYQHHNGAFHLAWHPKSSDENERTTTVLNTGTHRVLYRQIAGYVARRIVNYSASKIGEKFHQSEQCGFIKFGSRVDLFLPLDSEIHVKLDDKVTGTQTIIATLSKNSEQ